MAPPEVAFGDMPSSKVDFPTIEVSSGKIVATEVTSHVETVPAMTISTEATTADTPAFQVTTIGI